MVSEETVEDIDVVELEELGKSVINKLISGGLETVNDIVQAGRENVAKINGIGPKTVNKIFDLIDSLYEE
jgi:DNA-directed RNA polymerase alpha subunit